jgi:hypothetical protein
LPLTPFEYADFKRARVSRLDYHVECDRHYYSVPHALVGQEVELRVTRNAVEVLFRHQRVAAMPARIGVAVTRPWPSTCPRRIVRIVNGRRLACCTGQGRSASQPRAW